MKQFRLINYFFRYLIAPGVPGPLKSNSVSKNTPGDLSTASDREFVDIFLKCDVGDFKMASISGITGSQIHYMAPGRSLADRSR